MTMKFRAGGAWPSHQARWTMAVPVLLLALSGCQSSSEAFVVRGTAAPADLMSSSAPATGEGCPAGGAAVPKNSNWVGTDDLDGDGLTDQVWLAHDQGVRLLGVTTASGARFSLILNEWDPGAQEQRTGDEVSAVAGRLSDGAAIVLVDFGRSVGLYSVVNCYLVTTTDASNHPYLFDRGYAGTGDGVGCVDVKSKRVLVGYQAEYGAETGTYRVSRRTVTIDKAGKRATNGTAERLGTGLAETSATVNRAQGVSCGDNNTVTEPAS